MGSRERVIIRPSLWKMALLVGGATLGTAFIFYVTYLRWREGEAVSLWFLFWMVPPILAWYQGFRVLDPRCCLTLTERGFRDDVRVEGLAMRWSDVAHVARWDMTVRFHTSHYLAIVPEDYGAILGYFSPFRRMWVRLTRLLGFPPLTISLDFLDRSPDEAAELIFDFWHRHGRGQWTGPIAQPVHKHSVRHA